MSSSRAARPTRDIRCHSGVSRYHRAQACASAAAWSSSRGFRADGPVQAGGGGPGLAAGCGQAKHVPQAGESGPDIAELAMRGGGPVLGGSGRRTGRLRGIGDRGSRAAAVTVAGGTRQVQGMTQDRERGADIGEGGAVGAGRRCRRASAFGDRGQDVVQLVQQPRIVCGLAAGAGLASRGGLGYELPRGAGRAGGRGGPAGAVPSGGSEVADGAGGMVSSCISDAVPGGWTVLALARLGPGVAVPGVMPVPGVPAVSACGRGAVTGGCPFLAAGCTISLGLSSSARV